MFRSTAGQRNERKDNVIIGMAKFQRSLHNLDTTMIRKTLGKASREGAKPVLKAMRNEVKPISSTIADALGVNIRVYKRNKVVVAVIGVRNSPKHRTPYKTVKHVFTGPDPGRPWHDPRFTFHLVDLGTKSHPGLIMGRGHFIHPGTYPANIRAHALREASAASSNAYQVALQNSVNEVIG